MCGKVKKSVFFCGSVVVFLYGLMNLAAVILMKVAPWEKIGAIVDFVLSVDLVSWVVFAVFSVVIFILKLTTVVKLEKCGKYARFLKIDTILHIIFTVIAFVGIAILFDRAF